MNKIKLLVVDDEPLALAQMKTYIQKTPDLELVAACHSAIEAREVLENHVVDAMYLDINMPDMSGLEFVHMLGNPPLVVFTTAYSEYAVEGFKVNAVDYLLKPFSLADFVKSVDKLKARLGQEKAEAAPPVVTSEPMEDALFFRTDYRTVRVPIEDIRYVESMSEYIKVYVKDRPNPLLVLLSLKVLVGKLPEGRFMRIHRSYIISLSCLKEVGKGEVVLDDGTVLPVGDMYRQELKDYLNKYSLS